MTPSLFFAVCLLANSPINLVIPVNQTQALNSENFVASCGGDDPDPDYLAREWSSIDPTKSGECYVTSSLDPFGPVQDDPNDCSRGIDESNQESCS